MADLVSKEIFSVFGWERVGPTNTDWECVELEKHHKKTTKSHPSDVVFRYSHPYFAHNVYVTTDLKSYARDTIDKNAVARPLRELAVAVECANKSQAFQRLYVDDDQNWEAIGMLFVYNHDGDFDKDFNLFLEEIQPSQVPVPKGKWVAAIGPARVAYLNTIAHDILAERGRHALPDAKMCGFYYPDLNQLRVYSQRVVPAATLEMIMGPWQVLRYEDASARGKSGYYFYYDGKGESTDEFQYVLDYIFKYQLLGDNDQISLRLPFGVAEASAIFDIAKKQYHHDYWHLGEESPDESKARLERVSFQSVTAITQRFSDIEIGMTRE
jgi:hypothetical protein